MPQTWPAEHQPKGEDPSDGAEHGQSHQVSDGNELNPQKSRAEHKLAPERQAEIAVLDREPENGFATGARIAQ